MQRFYGFSLGLFFLSISFTFGTRVLGTANSTIPFDSLFTNPDGSDCQRLCVLGVQPGMTKAEDLRAILSAHPVVRNSGTYAFPKALMQSVVFGNTERGVGVQFKVTSDGLVDYVHVMYIGGRAELKLYGPRLGDIIQMFGNPDRLLKCVGGVVLVYIEAGFEFYVATLDSLAERYAYSEPVNEFLMFRPQKCPRITSTNSFIPWLGFTTRERYGNANLKYLRVINSGFQSLPIVCKD